MALELVVLSIQGAAAALTVGCIALVVQTVKNFQQSTETEDSNGTANRLPAAPHKHRPARIQAIESKQLLDSVKGNTRLLTSLGLPDELSPSLLIDDDHLSATAANIGFSNVELVIRGLINQHGVAPHLFGINRGGGLIANLLSQRLKLDQKFLVRCDYRPKWKRVLCEPRSSIDFGIILDDVVRSGETIKQVTDKLQEHFPKSKFYVIALMVCAVDAKNAPTRQQKLFDLVDYYPWISLNPRTSLPWSNGDSEDASDYIDEEGVDQVVGRLISHGADTDSRPAPLEESEHTKRRR